MCVLWMEVNGNLTRESPVCVSLAAVEWVLEENCCLCCCFWCFCWKPTDHRDAQPHTHRQTHTHSQNETDRDVVYKDPQVNREHHWSDLHLTFLSRLWGQSLSLWQSQVLWVELVQYVIVLWFSVSAGLTWGPVCIWEFSLHLWQPETNPQVRRRSTGEFGCGVPQGSIWDPL